MNFGALSRGFGTRCLRFKLACHSHQEFSSPLVLSSGGLTRLGRIIRDIRREVEGNTMMLEDRFRSLLDLA
jgi:hypothetical protein